MRRTVFMTPRSRSLLRFVGIGQNGRAIGGDEFAAYTFRIRYWGPGNSLVLKERVGTI